MKEFNMVPNRLLEETWLNSFRKTVQVKKHVTFEEQNPSTIKIDDTDLLEQCQPYFSNFSETDAWVQSRPANQERNAAVLEKWFENTNHCQSWKPISDLLLNTDEATFQYVLRQLCRAIGNNKFLIRGK